MFVLAGGLFAGAVQAHAPALLRACMSRLGSFSIGPVEIATQARVAALGDAVRTRLVAVLIGGRPGLSVADSRGCI